MGLLDAIQGQTTKKVLNKKECLEFIGKKVNDDNLNFLVELITKSKDINKALAKPFNRGMLKSNI